MKDELKAFVGKYALRKMDDSEMSRNGYYPKAEKLPIIIPDFLLRKSLGVSPDTVVTMLANLGIDKLEGQKVEVFKDVIGGKSYIRVYTPPPWGTTGADGNEISSNEVVGQWVEISERAPKERPQKVDGPKRSAGERIGEAQAQLGTDPRLGQFKRMISRIAPLENADGTPVDPKEFWSRVLAADVRQTPDKPSELDTLLWQVAGVFGSKDGKVDWAKTARLAETMKAGVTGEAHRVLRTSHKTLPMIADDVTRAVNASHAGGPNAPTSITAPGFRGELERLTGAKFVATETPTVIGTGKNAQAHERRLEVINNAQYDLNYAMWKFYPDEAGEKTIDALVAAAERGCKVNVIIDNNVARRDPGSMALLAKLELAGVNVMRFSNPDDPTLGMHAKMLLADCSADAIAKGGKPVRIATDRNDGTSYLHDQKPDDPKNPNFGWCGFDMVFTGSGAAAGMTAFRRLFNAGATMRGEPLMPESVVPSEAALRRLAPSDKSNQVMTLSDVAGEKNPQTISKAIEKLLEGTLAGQTVTCDQAYFMGLPGIEAALKRALERGVNLQVITNSAESCDVPGISLGTKILLERLSNTAGPYTGKLTMHEFVGKQTLHDKLMIFGNDAVMRMSFNQHGRSQTVESEDADVVFDRQAVVEARENIKTLLTKTRPIPPPKVSKEERSFAKLLAPFAMEVA